MAEIAVGIDLGTSNTCVALMREGQVEVLANAFGERTSASVVHFHDDGSVEVGNSAKAKVIHAPAQTVSSAKRLIGRYYFSEEVKKAQAIYAYEIIEAASHGVRIEIRDEEFSLPEISAMVLREMKQIAEAHTGEAVTKAVITVPAYFNDNQRQATKDAGRIAGLEVLRILNEPTAAALAYGFGMGLNQRVAVYDLGGGTFDISVLEIGKDIFEVLATCGDTFLGGDDFDDRLIDLLADEFVSKEGINPRNDPYAFEKLKLAAENAKKQLSIDEEVLVSIDEVLTGPDDQPRSLERTVTRGELANLVHDLILRTFKVCDEALQQADLTVRDLDGVILVGGPTRLPIVRDAVKSYFQQEPRSDVDPDEVVAMGAAIHAASLVGEAQDSMLLDVTPLDLRIGVAGGLAEPVIERNTPVPIEQTRTFTTFQDYQESVQIRVYQGDHRMAEDNTMLGQFEFAGFEKGQRSDVKIDVTFEIDADGIVNVTAADQATGQAASTQITLSSGLADEEMEKILDEDRAARVATPTSVNELIVAAEPDVLSSADAGQQSPEAEILDSSEDWLAPPTSLTEPDLSSNGEDDTTEDDSADFFDTGGVDLAGTDETTVIVMNSQDRAIDLEQLAVEDLDAMPDDALVELSQDIEGLNEDITLSVGADDPEDDMAGDPLQEASSDDDEFFDLSGTDLSDEGIELEIAIDDEET